VSCAFSVAVAGQPNSGKSTLFNTLTGARQFVANYPGVTVEKRVGLFTHKGNRITLVDLPGTYSLTSYSLEERVARDFLLDQKPDLVLNIVDASNLERNLYLTFQLVEMEFPLVVALNMMDIAAGRGIDVDPLRLSEELQVPVIPTVGNRGKGKRELREAIWAMCVDNKNHRSQFRVDYGEALESVIAPLEVKLSRQAHLASHFPARWLAVKLLEDDPEVRKLVTGAVAERDYRLSHSEQGKDSTDAGE
jgi:ferrous iron transport protein B